MKKYFKVVIIGVALLAGCTARKVVSTKVKKTVNTVSGKSGDYIESGVVLSAFVFEDAGYSEMCFYPSKIEINATPATKGEYKVVSLVGDMDVSKGSTHWTRHVILKSHPAVKSEITKGMIVLYVTDSNPCTREELKKSRWHRGVVLSTDELYKDVVKVGYVWHLKVSSESDRTGLIPLKNIRVVDSSSFDLKEEN